MSKLKQIYAIPYVAWLLLFVIAPVLLIIYQSFFDISGHFTLANYATYFTSGKYLMMTLNSIWYAFLITLTTLLISYPTAYFLTKLRHKDLLLLLIILPTWINLLLKAYAFIGIFGIHGSINQFLSFFGIAPVQIMFTDFSFMTVATYIELPFMILPIHSVLIKIDKHAIEAAQDLGANGFQVFRRIIFPLSIPGIVSGITMVFMPSVTTFAISDILSGRKISLMGNLIENQFVRQDNWHLGSAISIILIVLIFASMIFTSKYEKENEGGGLF